jgi:hypothetical protein
MTILYCFRFWRRRVQHMRFPAFYVWWIAI